MALTETNPHSGGQRGTRLVEGSHDTRRLYHSRAARDDRAGAFPLQEVTSGQLPRCAPSAAASCSTLCRTCRRAFARPFVRPARVAVVLPGVCASLASRVEPWDV